MYVLARRFGTDTIVGQARALDPGFDLGVLAEMIGTLDRFDDGEIPIGHEDLPGLRRFFLDWMFALG